MKTETWMLIIQNRYHTGFTVKKKKKFYRCEPDHTIEHAQWSHPRKLILVNLLVGRTKTLSFRQDRLPLSGIAEAVEKTKRAREKGENTTRLFICKCKWTTVNSFMNSSQKMKQKYFSDWHWLTAVERATFLYLSFLCNTIKKESCKNVGNLQTNTLDSYFKGSCV